MDPLLLAILITFAIRQAVENGKVEYAHVRDRRAAELARTYPNWSQGRTNRVARRAARGYWWNQIRRGFPEVRAAYAENKDLAEAVQIEAETAGLKRRVEVRERIRKALEEAEEIRKKERRREAGATADPDTKPRPADATPKTAPEPEPVPAPRAEPDPGREKPVDAPTPEPEPLPLPAPAPAAEPSDSNEPVVDWACSRCATGRSRYRPGWGHVCDHCWAEAIAEGKATPSSDDEEGPSATVIPLKPPSAPAAAPSTPTEGDNNMTTIPTGEYTGYEAAVANWNAIAALSQQLLAGYEQLMAQYRAMNVDDQTIGRASACHEAEEQHLVAVQSARHDFVSRHGAVKETKEATNTRGDEAVYTS